MNRQYHILIVEDRRNWQNILKKAVSAPNSCLVIAGDIEEARRLLGEKFFHLAIIDLSLVKDDVADTKGMALSNEIFESGLFNATKVIMISAYATTQSIREAFYKYGVIDFIEKTKFNSKDFNSQVADLLQRDIKLDIEIRWADQSNSNTLVSNLVIDGKRVSRDIALQNSLAFELEDLLCRLFYEAESLLVKPLTFGNSGAAVIMVTPFYVSGAGHPVVVKFGQHVQIDKEDRNYKNYVQQFVGHARHTSVMGLRRSLRLGGIVYSLVGGGTDKINNFQDFYSTATIEAIRGVLRSLFSDTCGNWYANKGKVELLDLSEDYQRYLDLSWEKIGLAITERLKHVHGSDLLYFDGLAEQRSFSNPLKFVKEKSFPVPTYRCITHGDLNPQNILLDDSGQTWLIDFGATGFGHILRDVAELEVAVKCRLLGQDQANLEERLQLEEALLIPKQFSDVRKMGNELSTDNQDLLKIYQTIVELRKIAQELVMQNPADDINEYYLALIYYSLNVLRFYGWDTVQREHALLSASLLAQRLGARSHA